ncbi:MAG: 2OG-Fe(II) oxygenase [Bacteriovorax sp.]|nr:2OG-Fe(II) oxygenase [Bacteriovorax sp.]
MDQENLIFSLIERGWYSCESFLDPTLCQSLITELNSFPLRASKIGKGSNEQIIPSVRNDSIYWLSETHNSRVQNEYLDQINKLIRILNRELYLGLKQFEGHFARYDQDGFYKKHLDQFKGNNERLVSVITYLNTPLQGGELKIYSRDNQDVVEVEIAPRAGTLVCFLSNQIYHEVLPTKSERLSIAGWLRTTIL